MGNCKILQFSMTEDLTMNEKSYQLFVSKSSGLKINIAIVYLNFARSNKSDIILIYVD